MRRPREDHYLYFTRKEKNGILFTVCIVLILALLPRLYVFFFPEKIPPATDLREELALLRSMESDSAEKKYYHYNKETRAVNTKAKKEYQYTDNGPAIFFEFDPNQLPATGWKKLGLKDKTIATIQKYISKGGKFREPADIKKIWGIPEVLAEKLLPYVKIKKSESLLNGSRKTVEGPGKISIENKPVDINLADSVAFEKLPGIGYRLASRIILFREKLGGFYSVAQLAETFGLPDSTFQKIKGRIVMENPVIRKINLNTATVEELKIHPYIRYKLAAAIVQYRNQHGRYQAVDEIKKIMLVDEEVYHKLSPYLVAE
jgi:competence ComEA-like helix-hairpin-helix protein